MSGGTRKDAFSIDQSILEDCQFLKTLLFSNFVFSSFFLQYFVTSLVF